jgi:hypothetical protein
MFFRNPNVSIDLAFSGTQSQHSHSPQRARASPSSRRYEFVLSILLTRTSESKEFNNTVARATNTGTMCSL